MGEGKPLFDAAAFGSRVLRTMRKRGESFREVQVKTGVDHVTVFGVSNGKPPSVENYLRLLRWLETGAYGKVAKRPTKPELERRQGG